MSLWVIAFRLAKGCLRSGSSLGVPVWVAVTENQGLITNRDLFPALWMKTVQDQSAGWLKILWAWTSWFTSHCVLPGQSGEGPSWALLTTLPPFLGILISQAPPPQTLTPNTITFRYGVSKYMFSFGQKHRHSFSAGHTCLVDLPDLSHTGAYFSGPEVPWKDARECLWMRLWYPTPSLKPENTRFQVVKCSAISVS